jgi:NADP-dependent 3-hydroxy acid dehydrogenase YdfG
MRRPASALSIDRILDVNLRGVLYISQAVIPQMRKQGNCVSHHIEHC